MKGPQLLMRVFGPRHWSSQLKSHFLHKRRHFAGYFMGFNTMRDVISGGIQRSEGTYQVWPADFSHRNLEERRKANPQVEKGIIGKTHALGEHEFQHILKHQVSL